MKTKTLTSLLASAALAFSVGASETNELEKTDNGGLKIEASMDVLSDYVWRGMICNGNPVWQPSVTLGYDADDLGAVSANVWQSYDLTHKRGTSNTSRRSCGLQEVDYTLAYANSIGPVGLEAGHVWYTSRTTTGTATRNSTRPSHTRTTSQRPPHPPTGTIQIRRGRTSLRSTSHSGFPVTSTRLTS